MSRASPAMPIDKKIEWSKNMGVCREAPLALRLFRYLIQIKRRVLPARCLEERFITHKDQ